MQIKRYNKHRLLVNEGSVDLDTTAYKVALFDATTNALDATHEKLGDLTGELSTANGYAAGGRALANVTLVQTVDEVVWSADNPAWTASGGSIEAKVAVCYADGTFGGITNPLAWFVDLDDSSGSATVTAADTEILTLQLTTNGMLKFGPQSGVATLALSSITPATGSTAGGESVTISGTGFDTASSTTGTIGGAAMTAITVVSDIEITATTPPGTAGAKDVVVTQGSKTDTLVAAFTYGAAQTTRGLPAARP